MGPKEMMDKITMYAEKYGTILKNEINALVEQYKPIIVPQMEKVKVALKEYLGKFKELMKKLTTENVKEILKTYFNKMKEQGVIITAKADATVKQLTKIVVDTTAEYAAVV